MQIFVVQHHEARFIAGIGRLKKFLKEEDDAVCLSFCTPLWLSFFSLSLCFSLTSHFLGCPLNYLLSKYLSFKFLCLSLSFHSLLSVYLFLFYPSIVDIFFSFSLYLTLPISVFIHPPLHTSFFPNNLRSQFSLMLTFQPF